MDHKINLFVGENGAGKTNILDSIYYLSFCKSNFQAVDKNCIKHGEEGFRIFGQYLKRDKKLEISVKLLSGKRKEIIKNRKKYKNLSDHIGLLPLVIISPDDIGAIIEGSEARRRLMDICLCQVDKSYLKTLIDFHRVLRQRNAYLKTTSFNKIDHQILDTFDEQLNPLTQVILDKRIELVSVLKPILLKNYRELSSKKEEVDLLYKSDIQGRDFLQLMQEIRNEDIRLCRTTKGIHRDDYVLLLDRYSAKKFGSQGQIKSVIISLKLAQAIYLADKKGHTPILLMDDIFDKLDGQRVKNLLRMSLADKFGQLFITDTKAKRISDILDESKLDYNCFEVQNGEVLKIEK